MEQWEFQNYTIFGDFNAVLFSSEKWGVNGFGLASKELISLVESPGSFFMTFPWLDQSILFSKEGWETLTIDWIDF